MKKIINILVIITLISIVFSFVIPSITYAKVSEIKVDDYKPDDSSKEDIKVLKDKAGNIVGILSAVGVVVSVVALMALGIKYMLGSVEQRAEYKKDFIPYIIGAFLVFTVSLLPQIIYTIMKTFNK